MVKKAVKSEDSISLDNILPAVDKKNIEYYDTLNQEQQKKFPSWLYMRYVSSVKGDPDLARYYLLATNMCVNKKFSDLKNHNKLHYLSMTAASPGLGKQYHQFIAPPKNSKVNKKRINLLEKLFPHLNDKELEVLDAINTNDDIKDHLMSLGWTDKDIKNAMSNKNTDED